MNRTREAYASGPSHTGGLEQEFYDVGMTGERGADRIILAQIAGAAGRHAARKIAGTGTDDDEAVRELTALAGDRPDLLAQHAGIAVGTSEARSPEEAESGREQARLCLLAGADADAVPQWTETGRLRAAAARRVPYTGTSGRQGRRSG